MSTFTTFNGPQGQYGPSAKDITQLVDAYTTLNELLRAHLNDTANSTGSTVHAIRSYVEGVKTVLETSINTKADNSKVGSGSIANINGQLVANTIDAINRLINYLEGSFAKTAALSNYVPNDKVSSAADSSNKLQAKTDVDAAINALNIDTYAKTDYVNEQITATVDMLSSGVLKELSADVIRASDCLIGSLRANTTVDYTVWRKFSAPFAGTGGLDTSTNGMYLLGCLSTDWSDDNNAPNAAIYRHKAGHAFIKYINTAPFDAAITFTATRVADTYIGTLTAQVSKQSGTWEDLAFHLALGTDSDGNEHVYLGISAKNLAYTSETYSNIDFRGCGTNFIPTGTAGFVMPSGMLNGITTAFVGTNTSGTTAVSDSTLMTIKSNNIQDADGSDLITTVKHTNPTTGAQFKQVFIGSTAHGELTFVSRPSMLYDEDGQTAITHFVTLRDLANIVMPVGSIIRWAATDEQGNLKSIPEGWLDITNPQLVLGTDYPDLAALFGTDGSGYINMPVETSSIVKARYYNLTELASQPDYAEIVSYTSISEALAKEVEDRTTADEELSNRMVLFEGAVKAETNRAMAAEDALDTRMDTFETGISEERTRAMAAESSLDNKITAETTRAKAAERTINNRIDAYHTEP